MERKTNINNAFYEELEEGWYEREDHPIALLRAENELRNPWILETIRKECGTNPQILDLGCGGGMLTNYLAEQQLNVTGIDLSSKSLEVAAQRDSTKGVKYLRADAQDLPFSDECFDVVCAMDLLEHVENFAKIVEQSARVLKKGGLFFFHTFNRNLWSRLLVIKGVEWCIPNTPSNMHVYPLFIKPEEMRRNCKALGLQIETLKGVSPALKSWPFWKTLFTRRIDKRFRFVFTSSLWAGYSGVARKIDSLLR